MSKPLRLVSDLGQGSLLVINVCVCVCMHEINESNHSGYLYCTMYCFVQTAVSFFAHPPTPLTTEDERKF